MIFIRIGYNFVLAVSEFLADIRVGFKTELHGSCSARYCTCDGCLSADNTAMGVISEVFIEIGQLQPLDRVFSESNPGEQLQFTFAMIFS